MKSSTCAASLLALAALAGCSDDSQTRHNPDKLWLALDGTEVQVRLVGVEPQPF